METPVLSPGTSSKVRNTERGAAWPPRWPRIPSPSLRGTSALIGQCRKIVQFIPDLAGLVLRIGQFTLQFTLQVAPRRQRPRNRPERKGRSRKKKWQVDGKCGLARGPSSLQTARRNTKETYGPCGTVPELTVPTLIKIRHRGNRYLIQSRLFCLLLFCWEAPVYTPYSPSSIRHSNSLCDPASPDGQVSRYGGNAGTISV